MMLSNPEAGLEARALAFATAAHGAINQLRKYTGEPYIAHPVAVAEIVRGVAGHTSAMIAAAYLHDVVEDTSVTIEDIEAEFGVEVATLVSWLTDVSTPADGNRAARKNLDHHHLMQAPPEAQTIKLGDILDNGLSIKLHDPDFWSVYRREIAALLRVMDRGDAALWWRAKTMVDAE